MFWYWYILVTNFVVGILVLSLIGKRKHRKTSNALALTTLVSAIDVFAFWRVYDYKLVIIPITITVYYTFRTSIDILAIDEQSRMLHRNRLPKTKFWTIKLVLLEVLLHGLTIVAAVVLKSAN